MNRKSILGLLLFACLVIAGLFYGTNLLISHGAGANQNEFNITKEESPENAVIENQADSSEPEIRQDTMDFASEDSWNFETSGSEKPSKTSDLKDPYETVPTPSGLNDTEIDNSFIEDGPMETSEDISADKNTVAEASEDPGFQVAGQELSQEDDDGIIQGSGETTIDEGTEEGIAEIEVEDVPAEDTLGNMVTTDIPDLNLIYDCNKVDYMKYIPEMVYDSKIEVALDIENPSLDINAKAAILFDTKTREVLYYKYAVEPVFPASTAKLLTTLVALDWCMEEEEVTAGEELKLVASDSTKANLRVGDVLTIRNLVEGMLLPSGNDAAYVTAAYVGRKALKDDGAPLSEAIPEFIRLMNLKAKSLGAVNSCFKTPDGYDAIGQYTTAFDMGMIGLAAVKNETILDVTNRSSSRNVFVNGRDVTWTCTNSLINKNSQWFYSYCIGLKTGTSTMAGRCLISAARKDGREVLSIVMNSDSQGRWEDSITLLKYGLSK